MSGNFDETWLKWAVKIEEEANCDIQAGLDLGQYLGEHLANSQGYISHERLMVVLKEELGSFLSPDDLEVIANATQDCARDLIKEKLHSSEVA